MPTTETALAVFEERGDTYATLADTMRDQLVTKHKHTESDTEESHSGWLRRVCRCVNAKMAAIYATNCYQQTKKGIESCRRQRFAVPPMSQVIVTERRAASEAWKWFNAGLKEHTGPLSPRLERLLKNKSDEYSVAEGRHFKEHYIRYGDPVCLTSDDLTDISGEARCTGCSESRNLRELGRLVPHEKRSAVASKVGTSGTGIALFGPD